MNEELIFRQKKALRDIIRSPLFDGIVREIKGLIADDFFAAKSDDLEQLHAEAKVLERFIGRLQVICNDVSMEE